MKDLAILASDGEIGHVEEFYFDDETWAIRYLVVNTGSWLTGRHVLISPAFLRETDWYSRQLHLALTKKQIENSPGIDTQKPVSRQHEAEYLSYYGSSYYWGGSYLWGAGPLPLAMLEAGPPEPALSSRESANSHLRSTGEVTGYHLEAAEGRIGHVQDFIVSPDTWNIRYLKVDIGDWLAGRTVLLAPEWIEKVSWADNKVYIYASRNVIETAPEYNEAIPITREYEDLLHAHYGKPPYWLPREGAPGK